MTTGNRRGDMLTIFGSMVLDTIHAPGGESWEAVGGSSTYAALAASRFTGANMMAIAGTDFPESYAKALGERLVLDGLEIVEGRTFRYEARYEDNLETRVDLRVEPNVSLGYSPTVPAKYRESDLVYLANTDPVQQASVLEQFGRARFVMCDTIGHWIRTKRSSVVMLIDAVDAVIINDGEARLLTGRHNLVECARDIMEMGAQYVIIKKAEHGSLLFSGDEVYPLPGFPLMAVADPTGAGDAFAGAVMGYLDSVDGAGVDELRRACMYGNVMGAFAVGERGVDGLLHLQRQEVERRMDSYRRMICAG